MIYRFSTIILSMVLALNLLFSCNNKLSVEAMQYATMGQKVYTQHCQNCHGANGEGLGKLYPPLTDAKYLNENRKSLPCIVKFGMKGEIQVDGKTYNQEMPGVPTLSTLDVAYVLSYVSTYFAKDNKHFSKEEVENLLKSCP